MSIAKRLKAAGIAPRAIRRLHGGDLSEVYRVETGHAVYAAKLGERVATEARMLRAMTATGAPVPRVIAEADGIIVLDYLHEGHADEAGWRGFGVALRAMHEVQGDALGWDEDYAFGAVAIPNGPCPDWPGFWAERRLLPFAARFPDLAGRLEALATRLPDLLPREARGLLHGDLWSGNLLFSGGRGWMIDPACYHGHGEVDLAMLTLFGAPPPAFDEGYGALEPGWDERRRVYQLFPALVHLSLFGAGYRGMVERLLPAG